jgi:8-oxo-dGTP pyrophosphatase MutT (NUDIX family)
MNPVDFLSRIHQLELKFASGVPGWDAQKQMAPEHRKATQEYMTGAVNPIASAVMLVLFPSQSSVQILLILRNAGREIHSGQVAFPGGSREVNDLDLLQTALRETHEETGINPGEIVPIGGLTNLYIPVSNFMVHPFTGYLKSEPVFDPNPAEVAGIIHLDIKDLMQNQIRKSGIFSGKSGIKFEAPYFDVNGYKVWGATAMILSEFREMALGIDW